MEQFNAKQSDSSVVLNVPSNLTVASKRPLGRFFEFLADKLYAVPPFIIHIFVTITAKILFKIFASFKVEGLENIKNLPEGVIFASNHTSELDVILIPTGLPLFSRFLPMFYTSRDKSFYSHMSAIKRFLYGGFFFKLLGAYEVYVGKFNYEASLKNHIPILEDNHSVCIFPEGKRSFDGKIGEAKGGVGYLAYRTGKPVVPVTIIGASNTSLFQFFTFRKKLKVVYGKPMFMKNLFDKPEFITISQEYDDCRIAAKKIMDRIRLNIY